MIDNNEDKISKMIEEEWALIFDTVETYEYRVLISKPDKNSVLFSITNLIFIVTGQQGRLVHVSLLRIPQFM